MTQSTKKTCPNGHQLEPGWKTCPYCGAGPGEDLAKTAAGPAQSSLGRTESALGRTVRQEVEADDLGKTVRVGAEDDIRRTKVLRKGGAATGMFAAWLVPLTGPERGIDFRLSDEQTLIGSGDDCDIKLKDEYISVHHASIRWDGKNFILTDLDSTNGTFVLDKPITKQAIKDGDVIQIGEQKYCFKSLIIPEVKGGKK
jgi:hypothetical protein